MSTAFRSGTYKEKESGLSFGSGEYGDLAAMTAAMLLDREARSVVLDADPAQGSLLEPILKVIRMMKSMEFKSAHGSVAGSRPDRPAATAPGPRLHVIRCLGNLKARRSHRDPYR